MAFNTKTDFSRQIIQHENTTAILSGNTSVLGDFYIKNIELTPEDITIGETLVYDGVRLKPGLTSSYQDRVIVGMGLSVDPSNVLNYNVNLGQYTISNTQYFYSGGTVTISDGDPSLSRFDIIYITSSNTPSVLMGTSANSPITPTLGSGQLSLGIILVPAGYYSGSTGTTVFTPTSSDTIFRYHDGYTSAIERSDGNSDALANFAMALSRDSRVTGQDGIALGLGTKANTNFQTSLGKYNEFDTDALLIVGYGQDDLNRANALTIDFSGNTKIHQKLYINDVQIDTGVPNLGDVLRYDGDKFSPETLVWNIEIPYYSFSGLTTYTANATYKVTGVHPELYGGTDIFIKTDDFGNLDTERAVGKFYNPKYNQNLVGFGVWNKYNKWDTSSIIGNFNLNENVTANNGATGQIYHNIYSGLFTKLTGDWLTATSITGNTSLAKANISSISLVNYTAGTKTIWGGYVWENLTGGTGNNTNILNLNTNDWVKIPFSSSSDYNVVYDEISFDINNDWIDRRYETGSENEVSETKIDYDFFGFAYPSISVFMWGNKYNTTLGVGLRLNKIKNSYCETVDFRGGSFYSNELKNNSIINNNTSIGAYITINNNILEATNCRISDNLLLNNYCRIYGNKLSNIDNKIYYNTLSYASEIRNNILNCSNGYFNSNILVNISKIKDNVLFGSNAIIQNNNLNNGSIMDNTLNGIVYIDANNLTGGGRIESNNLIGSNVAITGNLLYDYSYINYNFLKGDNNYIQGNNLIGNNCSISNNNLNTKQNTIRDNELLYSNSSIDYNTMLGSDNQIRDNEFNYSYGKIENNILSNECEIWGNIINGSIEISNNNLIEYCTINYNTISGNIIYNALKIKNQISNNTISGGIEYNEFLGDTNVSNNNIATSFNRNNLFNFAMNNVVLNYAITKSSFTNYELLTATTSYDKCFFIDGLTTSSTLDNIYIKKDNQLKEISLIDFNNLLNINISGSTFNPYVDTIGDISANTSTILDNDTINVFAGKTQGQIDGLIPKAGTTELTGDIIRSGDGESYFGVVNGLNNSRLDTYVDGSIRILENLAVTGGNSYSGTFMRSGTDVAEWNASVQGVTGDKNFSFKLNQAFLLEGAEIAYDVDRTAEIDANPLALINRAYADLRYSGSTGGSGGITNINGQTGTTQTLITGSTGNDFNINSVGDVHTFNIPTASSSTTRGLLTASDWLNFNNNQTYAINGLNKSGQTFKIGGSLIENTSIIGDYKLTTNTTSLEFINKNSWYIDNGSGFNSDIFSIVTQTDGKILVGGNLFWTYNGVSCPSSLLRLNSDGSVDSTFSGITTGFDNAVYSIAIQTDGKILVGGVFTTYNGVNCPDRLVRLNTNGSIDTSFNSGGTGFDDAVGSITIQNDGKIIVFGAFTTYNGVNRPDRLVRLNSNGSIDTSFNSGGSGFDGVFSLVFISVKTQTDDKILVGGNFTTYNGVSCPVNLVRLTSAGTIDSTFSGITTGFNNSVYSIAIQTNGKILAGGVFTTYNGVSCPVNLVRLNSNGTLDIHEKVFMDSSEGVFKYANKYHSLYNNRSLVDKEYVDLAVGSGGSSSSGITSINNQTNSVQTLITGNTGNDFNIISSGNTHIFNIPSASSSTTRGLLTASDWLNFNNKQNNLGLNTLGVGVASALTINTGTNGSFVIRGSSDYQTQLTFSNGLSNNSGVVVNNLLVGTASGQTIIGSTGTTTGLIYKTTTASGSTGADHIFQVGNNGATEAMRILNSGNVGIGINAPLSQLHVSSNATTATRGATIDQHSTNAASATLNFRKSRGTLASSTTVVDQDFIGLPIFLPYDGAAYLQTAGFGARVNGTVTTGSVPTDLFFYTGSVNTTNPYTASLVKMLIHSSGNIGIGTTTPNSVLNVNGSLSLGYVAKTATYTATANDYLINCTANTFTVTLPTAVGITGRIYEIVNSGAGTITIATTSSQTFTNVTATPTTLTLASALGKSIRVISNGANWLQLN